MKILSTAEKISRLQRHQEMFDEGRIKKLSKTELLRMFHRLGLPADGDSDDLYHVIAAEFAWLQSVLGKSDIEETTVPEPDKRQERLKRVHAHLTDQTAFNKQLCLELDDMARVSCPANFVERIQQHIQSIKLKVAESEALMIDLQEAARYRQSSKQRACPICLDVFTKERPEHVSTVCGHNFCLSCVQRVRSVCPYCKKDIKRTIRVFLMESEEDL